MSHFTVVVALPGNIEAFALDHALEDVLEPYYEGKEVPRYLSKTRQQIIDEERKSMHEYATEGLFAKYNEDPEAYIASTNNVSHLKYLGAPEEALEPIRAKLALSDNFFDKLDRERERERDAEELDEKGKETRALLDMTFPERYAKIDDDEFLYKLGAMWYEEDDLDEEGNAYSEYNPKSKWDWYVVGGRWEGFFNATNKGEVEDAFFGGTYTDYDNDGLDRVRVDELKEFRTPYAFVGLDGEWYQKGEMGWFGFSDDKMTQEEWDEAYKAKVQSLPENAWLVMVDAHI